MVGNRVAAVLQPHQLVRPPRHRQRHRHAEEPLVVAPAGGVVGVVVGRDRPLDRRHLRGRGRIAAELRLPEPHRDLQRDDDACLARRRRRRRRRHRGRWYGRRRRGRWGANLRRRGLDPAPGGIPFRRAALDRPGEGDAGIDHAPVDRELRRRHRVVGDAVVPAEVQPDHLAGGEVDDAGPGVAAERRAVVQRRVDVVAVARDGRPRPQLARLQPLDAVGPAEDLVLDVGRIARVEGRVAHDRHLPAGVGDRGGKHQLRPRGRSPLHRQQRHVPVRVDHHHPGDAQEVLRGAAPLAKEVDAGAQPRDEAEPGQPQPLGEDLRDMAVRHQQAVADDEAGPAVGPIRVTRQLDPADRGEGPPQPRADRLVVQVQPVLVPGAVVAADDVDRRPLLGDDDRLEVEALGRVQRDPLGELLDGPLPHRLRRPRGLEAGQFLNHFLDVPGLRGLGEKCTQSCIVDA